MNTGLLISTLEGAGFNVALAESDTELVMACPLCFSETPKLYVSTEHGGWICFKCDERGPLHRLLIEGCGLTPNEVYPLTHAILGGKKTQPALTVPTPPPPSTVELPSGFQRDYGNNLAGQYLESRGLKSYWAVELGMGYCLVGYYHHRVIVPVRTQGALRTFVARTWLPDEKKKILMPEGSQAGRALFGYDGLATYHFHGSARYLILVEGVFDAIHMWELGWGETLATLGAHITDLQRSLVKRLKPDRVYLLRDADEAGRDATVKEARQLAYDMIPTYIARLPEGTDPGSASPEDIRQALDDARPVELDYGIESQKEAHK